MIFTSAVFDTNLDPIWHLFLVRPSVPATIGLIVAAAFVGFWFGNVLATRSLYRTNCACHTPVRMALLKYMGISLAFTMMVLGSGCVQPMRCRVVDGVEVCAGDPTCRDTKTGRFIACPDKVTLEEMEATMRKVEKKAAKQRDQEFLEKGRADVVRMKCLASVMCWGNSPDEECERLLRECQEK